MEDASGDEGEDMSGDDVTGDDNRGDDDGGDDTGDDDGVTMVATRRIRWLEMLSGCLVEPAQQQASKICLPIRTQPARPEASTP